MFILFFIFSAEREVLFHNSLADGGFYDKEI